MATAKTAKPAGWVKATVPATVYGRVESDSGGYHADSVVPTEGYRLGPIGLGRSTYGWELRHMDSGLSLGRLGLRDKLRHAKRLAEAVLAVPDAVAAIECGAAQYGKSGGEKVREPEHIGAAMAAILNLCRSMP